MPTFGDYVDDLSELLCAQHSTARAHRLVAPLDGEVSLRLRGRIPLELRRSEGAFFTSRALADKLLTGAQPLVTNSRVIADPACGAGDLLLSAARMLPIARTVPTTLRYWGRRLVGRDLNPLYVRSARLRLALQASASVGRGWHGDEAALEELLPRITVGDGTALEFDDTRTLCLLNPPFGATVTRRPWGEGRVARAGVFTADIVGRLPANAALRAILPDVLRSGSNYRRWREHVEQRLAVERVEPVGQFDAWTDVDVFLLAGTGSHAAAKAVWWPVATDLQGVVVGGHFEVRVGPVVPHRDPIAGAESPYLRAHDLPQQGEHRPGNVRLSHAGRRFRPPLVVVRRTSRPEKTQRRVIATLVRGNEPVLVENHLLVCLPRDGELRTCTQLIDALATQGTTNWLDQRLRCRHLTVAALREVPLPGWSLPDPGLV